MKIHATIVICSLLLAGALSAAERVALVIGNDKYQHSRALANPKNDANAIAETLRGLNFTVIQRTDATLKDMKSGIREFVGKITKGGTAMVFYAGHGVQIEGTNYLVPVDAEMAQKYEVPDETISMDMILRALEDAGGSLNLLVLDSCRDNPFSRSWRGSRNAGSAGLGGIDDMPSGMYIAYATSPGKVASDGDGKHSPYTAALLAELKSNPHLPVETLFKNVGRHVVQATNGNQEPWTNSKFYGNFSFASARPNLNLVDPTDHVRPSLEPGSTEHQPSNPAIPSAPELPERGYFDLSEIYIGSAYADFNRYSKAQILRKAQQKLKDSGYYIFGIDGDPGPGTQKAIISWQKEMGVAVSGRLDTETLLKMGLGDLDQMQPPRSTTTVTQQNFRSNPQTTNASGFTYNSQADKDRDLRALRTNLDRLKRDAHYSPQHRAVYENALEVYNSVLRTPVR